MSEPARRALAQNPVWYHSIELAPGVVTPGHIDLRRVAPRVLPADLGGRRALDVGTFDGFWAFELERRGAEVVAVDLDHLEAAEWPPLHRERLEREARAAGVELGLGFRLAAEALGSGVERRAASVYELTPERVGGAVDLAFSGALMLHLRDPVGALERIRACIRPGGELRLLEPVSPRLTLLGRRRPAAAFSAAREGMDWWVPNLAAIGAWLRAAGFRDERRLALARPPARGGMRRWHAAYVARA